VSDTDDLTNQSRVPFWRHLLAMVYDLFLIIPLLMLTSAILVGIHGPTENAAIRSVPAWQQWGMTYLALMGFYGTFWRKNGQTLGMQAWRIKLVSTEDTDRVTWPQVAIRVIAASTPFIAALLPYLFFDINNAGIEIYFATGLIASSGFMWRYSNPRRFYLHDQLSGTSLTLVPPRKKR
jgi:uncharacterized RDD family membrane protein YckC